MWKKTASWCAVALLMCAGAVFAQEAAEGVEAGGMQETMTLRQVLETGGWLMYVLGAMSVIGLAFVVYFFIVLREEQVTPREFTRDLYQMLTAGRLTEARAACEKNNTPASAVAEVAVEYMQRTDDVDPGLLKEIMEGEGSRQATLIQNQTQYLLDIAVIAPMVGLLGTVMGMLQAFNAVALDIAKAKPMVLAHGVSQALITTAAGLIVGIPAMIFYAYFRGKSSKLISNLESVAAELLSLLGSKRKQVPDNAL
jgi:biopolymer transport protein ExbB